MVRFAVDKSLSLEKQSLIKMALVIATDLTGSDGGSVMLVEGDNLVIRAYIASDPSIDAASKMGISVKVGERASGKAAQTGESVVIVGDINKDTRFSGIQKFHEIKSGASVPVKKDNLVKGVINVHRVKSSAPITKDDVDVVGVVGKSLAEAL
ncbi:MAG: GAF domain-containing protein [Endomicrobiia bacterium]|nr:GAF domain-containing protein [Endomicrobiia bacterium]